MEQKGLIQKLPPHDLELEEAVLGAMLLEKDALLNIVDILNPYVFYLDAHRHLYLVIQELFAENIPVDLMTVVNRARKKAVLNKCGGAAGIAQVTNRVNSAANIETHARALVEMGMKREVIRISQETFGKAYLDTEDVFELVGNLDAQINDIVEQNTKGSFVNFQQSILATFDHLYDMKDVELTGVPSGFQELDRVTGGWQNSDLIILAARPGMGKTAFVVSCMLNAANLLKAPVGMFSLEMATTQLNQRILSSESNIHLQKVIHANLSDQEWGTLHTATTRIASYPIYIDDTPSLTIVEMRAKARRLKRKAGIKLLIVDYLQLMSGRTGSHSNREQEIANISRGLKSIAKELEIPVIALSQLSRAVEQRGGDKKPQLSDLRESGAIEQDADLVGFLYRPEYYGIEQAQDGTDLRGRGMVIISKNRQGALKEVFLKFIGQNTKWVDDDTLNTATQFPIKN
jgi:replicative DNA helicase